MKITYTEEAIADIVEAISYLNDRSPTAASKLDADIARCIERLADWEAGLTAPLGCWRAELGRAAVPRLLPASSWRALDSARLPPEASTDHAVSTDRQRARRARSRHASVPIRPSRNICDKEFRRKYSHRPGQSQKLAFREEHWYPLGTPKSG